MFTHLPGALPGPGVEDGACPPLHEMGPTPLLLQPCSSPVRHPSEGTQLYSPEKGHFHQEEKSGSDVAPEAYMAPQEDPEDHGCFPESLKRAGRE